MQVIFVFVYIYAASTMYMKLIHWEQRMKRCPCSIDCLGATCACLFGASGTVCISISALYSCASLLKIQGTHVRMQSVFTLK